MTGRPERSAGCHPQTLPRARRFARACVCGRGRAPFRNPQAATYVPLSLLLTGIRGGRTAMASGNMRHPCTLRTGLSTSGVAGSVGVPAIRRVPTL